MRDVSRPLRPWPTLRLSKNRMFFTSAKAERVLGDRTRPYREALVDAFAWFDANGYLQ